MLETLVTDPAALKAAADTCKWDDFRRAAFQAYLTTLKDKGYKCSLEAALGPSASPAPPLAAALPPMSVSLPAAAVAPLPPALVSLPSAPVELPGSAQPASVPSSASAQSASADPWPPHSVLILDAATIHLADLNLRYYKANNVHVLIYPDRGTKNSMCDRFFFAQYKAYLKKHMASWLNEKFHQAKQVGRDTTMNPMEWRSRLVFLTNNILQEKCCQRPYLLESAIKAGLHCGFGNSRDKEIDLLIDGQKFSMARDQWAAETKSCPCASCVHVGEEDVSSLTILPPPLPGPSSSSQPAATYTSFMKSKKNKEEEAKKAMEAQAPEKKKRGRKPKDPATTEGKKKKKKKVKACDQKKEENKEQEPAPKQKDPILKEVGQAPKPKKRKKEDEDEDYQEESTQKGAKDAIVEPHKLRERRQKPAPEFEDGEGDSDGAASEALPKDRKDRTATALECTHSTAGPDCMDSTAPQVNSNISCSLALV